MIYNKKNEHCTDTKIENINGLTKVLSVKKQAQAQLSVVIKAWVKVKVQGLKFNKSIQKIFFHTITITATVGLFQIIPTVAMSGFFNKTDHLLVDM